MDTRYDIRRHLAGMRQLRAMKVRHIGMLTILAMLTLSPLAMLGQEDTDLVAIVVVIAFLVTCLIGFAFDHEERRLARQIKRESGL